MYIRLIEHSSKERLKSIIMSGVFSCWIPARNVSVDINNFSVESIMIIEEYTIYEFKSQ